MDRGFRIAGAGLIFVAFPPSPAFSTPAPERPNVVFILADDLGWRDTSLYGSRFCATPNIDRLAARGMTFSQAYAANPLCSPTRASLLTGLWPARVGITTAAGHLPEERLRATVPDRAARHLKSVSAVSATRLRTEYVTLAEAVKSGGYRTGHFGKWHLGPDPYDPRHQGFDVDVPAWSGPGPAGSYLAPWKFPAALKFTGVPGEHIEDRMAAEAARFIRENKDVPFFLDYWAFSVHAPFGGKPGLIGKYRAKADPDDSQRCPVYGAMVHSLDDAVGTLVGTLDALDLSRKTILVFFSDNGGNMYDRIDGIPPTSNAPLRGGKATIYEGGTRVPCSVVWPGVVKAGTWSDAVIQSIDFHPTLLEMLGLRPREGQTFDGISIVPALRGGTLDREAIFCHFPHDVPATGAVPSAYVRKGDWKLIRFFHQGEGGTHRYELYNLKDDPGEAADLSGKMTERVRELDALLEKFLQDSKAALPRANPAYDPEAVPPNRAKRSPGK